MESTIVSSEQLKNLTSISNNLDAKLLEPHLLIAQQLYVQPILGAALYNDIITKYDNNNITGNTLILYNDYIIPAIGFSAWFSVAPFLNYKTQAAGIQTITSQDNTPVTPEELSTYIQRVENLKDFYCKRLREYLFENRTLFSLYRTEDSVQTNTGGQLFLGFKHTSRKNNYGGEDTYNVYNTF